MNEIKLIWVLLAGSLPIFSGTDVHELLKFDLNTFPKHRWVQINSHRWEETTEYYWTLQTCEVFPENSKT